MIECYSIIHESWILSLWIVVIFHEFCIRYWLCEVMAFLTPLIIQRNLIYIGGVLEVCCLSYVRDTVLWVALRILIVISKIFKFGFLVCKKSDFTAAISYIAESIHASIICKVLDRL